MWNTILKYGIFSLFLLILAFFIMHKNMEYQKLEKEERELIKKIYESEETRRYYLYQLENLKKEKNYVSGSEKVMVLNPEKLEYSENPRD